MKHTSILIAALIISLNAAAQEGFVMSGASTQSGGASTSSSMGQTCQNHVTNSSGSSQEGLQHPFEYADVVSVDELASTMGIQVFPNPATEMVQIEFQVAPETPVHIELFDPSGKSIYTATVSDAQHHISLTSFSQGMYYLTLHVNNEQKTIQITKQ